MSDQQTPFTPEQEMQQRYINVFSSREGQLVLGDIARLFHLFDPVEPTDTVLNTQRSCALVIFQLAGAFNPLYAQLGLVPDSIEQS